MSNFDYQGSVFRPPSEASSLILQVTIGCSHNACSFCDMYKDKKFRIRSWDEFQRHAETVAQHYPRPEKIFLADGNCLAVGTDQLLKTLSWLKERFPTVRRITSYAGPGDILSKTAEELKAINQAGISMLYMGIESGNDGILRKICKGVTAAQMVEAGQLARQAGFKMSVTVISGMGGATNWQDHALDSARVVSQIDPEYLGLLTLMVRPGTLLYRQVQAGEFQLADPRLVAAETRLLLENLQVTKCVFRSNHASNYLPLAGDLPADQGELIASLTRVLDQADPTSYKSEGMRRL